MMNNTKEINNHLFKCKIDFEYWHQDVFNNAEYLSEIRKDDQLIDAIFSKDDDYINNFINNFINNDKIVILTTNKSKYEDIYLYKIIYIISVIAISNHPDYMYFNKYIETLLIHNYDPNLISKRDTNISLLMFAIACESINCVKFLLKCGANPNFQNENGITPSMVAAMQPNSSEIIKLLLEHNADPNLTSKSGWTALMCAVRYSKSVVENVKILLGFNMSSSILNADTNIQNNQGSTALIIAVGHKGSDISFDVVKLLLDNNADPNLKTIKGWTALMFLARNSTEVSLNVMDLLLNNAADPNFENSDEWSALLNVSRYATFDPYNEIPYKMAKLLLKKKADSNIKVIKYFKRKKTCEITIFTYPIKAVRRNFIYNQFCDISYDCPIYYSKLIELFINYVDKDEQSNILMFSSDAPYYSNYLNSFNRSKSLDIYFQNFVKIVQLKNNIECLNGPCVGNEFINSFIDSYDKNDQQLKESFINNLIPILENQFDDILHDMNN